MMIPLLAMLALAQTAAPMQVPPAAPPPPTAPIPPSDAQPAGAASAAALTDAEQKTLKRCQAMGPGQAAQSSKCSAVMTKAGQADPSKMRTGVPR